MHDWWRHLRKHIGIIATNYFMYGTLGPVCSPHPSELLHLNQSCVQDLKRTLVAMSERTGMSVSQVTDEVLYTGLIEMQEL